MIDEDELPDGWALATLGEVTEPKIRQGEPSGTSPEFTYIDITAVDNALKTIVEPKTLPVKGAPSRARQHVRPGDVLVSMTRPNLNAVAVVPERLAGSIASTGFHILRPREMLSEWLFTIVRSTAFVTAMSELVQGALYPAVRPSDIRVFTIPVPPLAEQRRIMAKIEELTAQSRAARVALAEVPTLLEQFRQSVLASAFRGDLTAGWREKHPDTESASVLLERIRDERRKQWEAKYPKKKYVEPDLVDATDLPELPEGWEYARADEIVATGTVITYGIVLPGDHVEAGVPYVRGQDIEDGRILVDQLARTSPEIAARHDRSSLLEGDVLLCIIRHLKVAIVPMGMDGANLTQGTVRLRPSEAILGPYLAGFLAGPTAQGWMKKRYFGMAMPRINVEDARAIPIPVAPLEEQREIIRQIEISGQRQQAAVAAVNQALDEMNNLDQSILAKAFRGELVSQDPDDEPAAALLARIRTGGSATTPSTATRSAKRGQVKFYILLLLRTWSKPLGREMLERGLVLMLNADVRRAILGRSKPATKPTKKRGTPPQFVSGMDELLGEMIDDGQLVPGPEAGFFAEGQHGIDFTDAPKTDLDAVRETAEAMKVLHKDTQQATDADIVSALNGEIYELVS